MAQKEADLASSEAEHFSCSQRVPNVPKDAAFLDGGRLSAGTVPSPEKPDSELRKNQHLKQPVRRIRRHDTESTATEAVGQPSPRGIPRSRHQSEN